MITGTSGKSPSLASTANRAISVTTQPRTRSITGLGMFRSMRQKTKYEDQKRTAEGDSVELQELHRRARSWNKRQVFYCGIRNVAKKQNFEPNKYCLFKEWRHVEALKAKIPFL
jgi:hypothetical protein